MACEQTCWDVLRESVCLKSISNCRVISLQSLDTKLGLLSSVTVAYRDEGCEVFLDDLK